MIFKLSIAILLSLTAVYLQGAEDYPLNISKIVNMGFKDQTAGDGRGGWSDQGANNDMRDFNIKRKNYHGITFSILNPKNNKGKAIITFDNSHAQTGVKERILKLKSPYPKAKFLYLLHTSCWNNLPQNTQIGWIEATFKDGSKIRKDIRNDVELTDWWNAGNCKNGLVVIRKKNKSAQVGIFLSKLELANKAKELVSLTLHSNGNVVWIVVGMTLSNQNTDLQDKAIVFTHGKTWKAVDMSDVQVKSGSALDLSLSTEPGPAGKFGRAIIGKNGKLVFEKAPGKTVRFQSFNGLHKTINDFNSPSKKESARRVTLFAELAKRQGYNMIRPMVLERYIMDGSKINCQPNPAKMDIADKLIYELKKRGIYIELTIGGYRLGAVNKHAAIKRQKDLKAGVLIGDKEIRSRWEKMAKQMLNHVNPYTGIAWKDDPAIVYITLFNEQEAGYYFISKMGKNLSSQYNKKWQSWLENKYKTTANLAKAWNRHYIKKYKKFTKVKMPASGVWGRLPRNNDFGIFLGEISKSTIVWYKSVLKKIGYKGLITQFDLGKQLFNSEVRWGSIPLVAMHSYFNHPSRNSRPGSKCKQNSSISMTGDYWRSTNATRFADRPFIITEYNHSFWNQYQHECGLLFPAYSAFQGFSGLTVHEDAVAWKINKPTWEFSISHSPIGRANEFLSSCLFLRGDVSKYKYRVELGIPQAFLNKNSNSVRAVNTEQSKIALMTGFNIAFPNSKQYSGVPQSKRADIEISPDSGALIKGGEWSSSVMKSKTSKFDISKFTKLLKRKGILSKSNLSDPANEVFQSENGEITMRAKENLIKIRTKKTEGVSIGAGKSEKIDSLEIISSNTHATIAICSIDGKAIQKSSRMVLIYSTETANNGMKLSGDRVTLQKIGTLPILMRCGKLKATLKSSNAKKMALYALGINGSRKEKLELSVINNKININIDTSKLKNGPTPFFELVVE